MDKVVRLMLVSENNNNKFYDMIAHGDTFTANWGRVGAKCQTKDYPISSWDKVYREKTNPNKSGGPYTDVTAHASINKTEKNLNIKDKDVKALINFLMSSAKQSITESYTVAVNEVTKKQLESAQELLEKLSIMSGKKTISTEEVNEVLLLLYRTIPRKMKDTRKYLLQEASHTFLDELLANEQNLLNTLSTQVVVSTSTSEEITLDSLNLSVEVASAEDRERIAKETDFKVGSQKIFKVINKDTEKVFESKGKTKLLYHGSRNENYLSIMMNGLKVNPVGVQINGKMFGYGVYAANKAQKSIGYTSLRGSCWATGSSDKAYLAIFEFNLGKMWDIFDGGKRHDSSMCSLNEQKVSAKGYDSVYAKGGYDLRNDEFIVYRSTQCTIKYLIELSK